MYGDLRGAGNEQRDSKCKKRALSDRATGKKLENLVHWKESGKIATDTVWGKTLRARERNPERNAPSPDVVTPYRPV